MTVLLLIALMLPIALMLVVPVKKNAKSNAETTTITIVLNNQSQTCESPISVGEIVHGYATNVEGTAVAYNHSILSKSQWFLTHLQDGDHIDIFTLVAGG